MELISDKCKRGRGEIRGVDLIFQGVSLLSFIPQKNYKYGN